MLIGTACTLVKALGLPGLFIVYGEFTILLVERTLGYCFAHIRRWQKTSNQSFLNIQI